MSYWRLPDNLYDDPDELARWARRSLAVARQGAKEKRVSPGSRGKPQKKAGSKRKRR